MKTRDFYMTLARKAKNYMENNERVDYGTIHAFPHTQEDISRMVRRARELNRRNIRDKLNFR